ncbi:helix-turn-helix transcriptional regulator [Methyloversatilis sp. XJ19-13]|nr:helix-turn-helix transcriptional regulator [Methyloversatilis sp. XJ19-13]
MGDAVRISKKMIGSELARGALSVLARNVLCLCHQIVMTDAHELDRVDGAFVIGMPSMTDNEFDQCVAGFYQAASGQVDWGQALRALHEAFSLWAIHIFGLDMASGTITFSFEVGDARPEAAIDFARTWHRHDPRTRLALQLDEGQWMNCREHFDDAFVARDPFYQEFLIPYGGRWVSGMKLVEDGAFVSLLAMMRGPHQIPFSKSEDALAHRLAHHLSLAVKLYRTNSRLANQASNSLALLGKIEAPLLLIDEQRRIHFANPAARSILDAAETLVERGDELFCRRAHDDTELLLALRRLRLSNNAYLGDAVAPEEKAFMRCALPGSAHHFGVYLNAIRPETSMGAFGRTPLAMVLLHDPRRRLQLDPFMVGAAFDLTPAESQLAVGIARGMSVNEVAIARGVSIETVRSQVKSIFAKTGTSQQSDLVSLLATLPTHTR